MKSKKKLGIVAALLLLLLTSKLYLDDSATVKQAIIVEEYLQDYCRLHSIYPEFAEVQARFPDLYPDQEWYYWLNDTRTRATFQYPMTLPLPSAPGSSKISEFIPIIYSYAVFHPCDGLI